MAEFGAQSAFRRTLPFSEITILSEIQPYLKRTLNLVDVDVLAVEEARLKGPGFMDSAKPAQLSNTEMNKLLVYGLGLQLFLFINCYEGL